jgi:predicted restriction endonuclease
MFKRNCPQCGKEQSYSTKGSLKHAIESNKTCRSCSQKGKKMPPFSEETRRNMSIAQKGKKKSEEHKAKIAKGMTGYTHTEEARRNMSIAQGGNGVLDKEQFNCYKLRQWAKDVRERDDYLCQHCLYVGAPNDGILEAHHIVKKSKFPQYAYDLDNGITLCKTCHIYEHKHYG